MSTTPPPADTPAPYPTPSSLPPAYPANAPSVTGWGPPGPAPGLIYAPFWTRVVGYLVDVLLLTAVEAPVTLPLLFAPAVQFIRDHPVPSGQPVPPFPADLSNRFLILGVVGAVVSALYFGGLVAWQGRTLGQRVVGTFVVRAEDGGKLPADRAYLRAIVFYGPGVVGVIPAAGSIASLVALVAMLAAAWDQRKQGWHDKLGRSLVVRRMTSPPGYLR
jgi:uncharacterized RDD family membrane protein YckC